MVLGIVPRSDRWKMSRPLQALKLRQVEKKVQRGHSWIYERVAEGKFPRPARDGRSVFWFEHEIDEYLEQLAAARDRQPDGDGEGL